MNDAAQLGTLFVRVRWRQYYKNTRDRLWRFRPSGDKGWGCSYGKLHHYPRAPGLPSISDLTTFHGSASLLGLLQGRILRCPAARGVRFGVGGFCFWAVACPGVRLSWNWAWNLVQLTARAIAICKRPSSHSHT